MEYDDLKQIIKTMDKSESELRDDEEGWSLIPENILVRIFKQLSVKDILNSSETCKRWNFISNDSILWKYKFTQDFKVDKSTRRKPGW
jgi:F-box-like